MSDDLVQRLRNWEAGAAMRPTLYDEAADRIEALETALERIAASGWPSDFRQDPPQAIAREALDDNAR